MQFKNFLLPRLALCFVVVFFMCSANGNAQADTLHLNYYLSQVMPHDTTSAKIDKWVKSLKGQPVKITVAAYYHKPEFKKFAQQRCDELFLVLNRKARSLITIESIGPRKGKDFQRSMVDIIYSAPGSQAGPAPEKAADGKAVAKGKEEAKPAAQGKNKASGKANAKKENQESTQVSHDNNPIIGGTPENTAMETNNEEYRNHTLVLALPSENGEKVAKLQKKQDGAGLAAYREEMKVLGETLERMFNENWTGSKVKVVKESDLGSVNFSEMGNWIFMKCGTAEVSNIEFLTLKAQLGSGSGPGADVGKMFRVSKMGKTANDGDILVLIHKVKVFYGLRKEFDRSQLQEILAAKTLNFSPDQSELNGSEFTKNYRYPFEIVYKETLINKITGKEKGILYLRPDVLEGSVNLMIIDAENGAIIARTPKTAGTKVKASSLKELSDESKQISDVKPLTIY